VLTDTRVYNWVPRHHSITGPPFVYGETPRARLGLRRYLIAGDGHRIPFPRRVLNSERYFESSSCNVRLFVETDNQPYPGINYVMEIHLPGNRELFYRTARVARQVLSALRSPAAGRVGLLGPLAAGVMIGAGIMLDPSPLAGESHWTARTELDSGPATIRYDYLP
jgi:hypothetical protein